MSDYSKELAIRDTIQTPGWAHIEAMLLEQSAEPKDELYEILSSARGDSIELTTARRLATRAKALQDFRESIYDRIKVLNPTREGGR